MVSVARAPQAPLANGPSGGAPPPPQRAPPGHPRPPNSWRISGSRPGCSPDPRAYPPSPSVIGNVFVSSTTPSWRRRWTSCTSSTTTGHCVRPGALPVWTAPPPINGQRGGDPREVQQLGYRGKRCEVATVDSSHSIGGAVVMVTGAIVGVAAARRLRRRLCRAQEGGLRLNDIVRFVDAETGIAAAPRAAPPPNVAAHEPPPRRRRPRGAGGGGDRANRREETGKGAFAAAKRRRPEAEVAKESEGPTTTRHPANARGRGERLRRHQAASPPRLRRGGGVQGSATASSATGASRGREDDVRPGDGRVHRNIPQSADEASIDTVRGRSVHRHRDHSNCGRQDHDATGGAPGRYAFVQFEKAESAQAAIEATVEMDGRALSVEEKREGGHNNRNQGGGNNRRNDARAQQKPGAANGGGNNRREGTRGPRRDGEGGKHQHQGERRPGGGPRREGGDRRQPARQPAAAKA